MVNQDPPSQMVGSYELLEKIHEGGMGAIYRARHRFLKRICVVKAIRAELEGDVDLERRFLQEATAATHLRHPNIAEIYDFFVAEDGRRYIVMELIRGRSLAGLLRSAGPPPLALTLAIGRQALRALGFLHKNNFVHRDVSPDNLMLTEDVDGEVLLKVIDLGIVKSLEGTQKLTQTGTFLGKTFYAAPEQFGGAGGDEGVDARSDLYSLGVVLYELLTNALPIQGSDHLAIISGHLFRPPLPFALTDPRGRVPEELRGVVLKALAKPKDERFQTASEFAAELARCADRLTGDEDATMVLVDPPRRGAAKLAEPAGASHTPPAESAWRRPASTGTAHGPEASDRARDAPTLLARTGAALTATLRLVEHPARWLLLGGAVIVIAWLAVSRLSQETGVVPRQPAPRGALAKSPIRVPSAPAPEPLRQVPVDASPWAEVVNVVREDGTAVDIGAQRFTPLVLELAPGSYAITLQGGTRTERRTAKLTIPSDPQAQVPSIRLTFPGLDAEGYLKSGRLP